MAEAVKVRQRLAASTVAPAPITWLVTAPIARHVAAAVARVVTTVVARIGTTVVTWLVTTVVARGVTALVIRRVSLSRHRWGGPCSPHRPTVPTLLQADDECSVCHSFRCGLGLRRCHEFSSSRGDQLSHSKFHGLCPVHHAGSDPDLRVRSRFHLGVGLNRTTRKKSATPKVRQHA